MLSYTTLVSFLFIAAPKVAVAFAYCEKLKFLVTAL